MRFIVRVWRLRHSGSLELSAFHAILLTWTRHMSCQWLVLCHIFEFLVLFVSMFILAAVLQGTAKHLATYTMKLKCALESIRVFLFIRTNWHNLSSDKVESLLVPDDDLLNLSSIYRAASHSRWEIFDTQVGEFRKVEGEALQL